MRKVFVALVILVGVATQAIAGYPITRLYNSDGSYIGFARKDLKSGETRFYDKNYTKRGTIRQEYNNTRFYDKNGSFIGSARTGRNGITRYYDRRYQPNGTSIGPGIYVPFSFDIKARSYNSGNRVFDAWKRNEDFKMNRQNRP